jgi:hypothetical protein
MATAQQVFETSVRRLPASERLRLATLILDELTATSADALDYSDTWTEEDVRDLAAFSSSYAASLYPEEEEIA